MILTIPLRETRSHRLFFSCSVRLMHYEV
jgi:hypothetical protein